MDERTTIVSELSEWLLQEQKRLQEKECKLQSWQETILEMHVAFVEDALLNGGGSQTLAAADKLLKHAQIVIMEAKDKGREGNGDEKEKLFRLANDMARREGEIRKKIQDCKRATMVVMDCSQKVQRVSGKFAELSKKMEEDKKETEQEKK